jgi:hypothetical protein
LSCHPEHSTQAIPRPDPAHVGRWTLRQIYVGPPISRKQRAPGNFMLNAQGFYVEAYVCDHCRMTCESVYELATTSTSTYWLCCGSKEAVTTKQEQRHSCGGHSLPWQHLDDSPRRSDRRARN